MGRYPTPPAGREGWYRDPAGTRRWWTGRAWGRSDGPSWEGMCGTDNGSPVRPEPISAEQVAAAFVSAGLGDAAFVDGEQRVTMNQIVEYDEYADVAFTIRVHDAGRGEEWDRYWAEIDERPGLNATGGDLPELFEALAEAISFYDATEQPS